MTKGRQNEYNESKSSVHYSHQRPSIIYLRLKDYLKTLYPQKILISQSDRVLIRKKTPLKDLRLIQLTITEKKILIKFIYLLNFITKFVQVSTNYFRPYRYHACFNCFNCLIPFLFEIATLDRSSYS